LLMVIEDGIYVISTFWLFVHVDFQVNIYTVQRVRVTCFAGTVCVL
jgi:hypothetical protein